MLILRALRAAQVMRLIVLRARAASLRPLRCPRRQHCDARCESYSAATRTAQHQRDRSGVALRSRRDVEVALSGSVALKRCVELVSLHVLPAFGDIINVYCQLAQMFSCWRGVKHLLSDG